MKSKEIVVARSRLASPGLDVSSKGLANLPIAQFLKRLIVRLRFVKNPNANGVGAFRESGAIFIRVPKNATSSVCDLIYGDVKSKTRPAHQSAEFYRWAVPKVYAQSVTCASIRNPRERFYSAFNYYKHSSPVPEERRLMDEDLSFIQTMDDFIGYLKDQPDLSSTRIMRWHHFRQQVDFITDRNGRVILDMLFPVENPDGAMSLLKKRIGFSGELKRRNVSKGDRSGDWPDFLAAHYSADQSLWDQVIKETLVFPTDKIERLNLLP